MGRVKNTITKLIVEISRIILGITFVFSGFVKSVDPLGTAYKIQDYLTSFNLADFHSLGMPIAIILCAGEFCLGLFILFGLYRKWVSILLLLVMLFMTPLTLYLAIANPVKDCGCFGDALIITNWETFFKNIILLICAIIVVLWNQKITNLFTGKFYWLVAIFIIIFSFSFCIYNLKNEPILDFRPYKIGANIPKLMTIEDSVGPVYENVFVYKKDGVEKEFTENNYPWKDSTWVFVDIKSKLLKEGKDPVIHDFSINQLYLNRDRTKIEKKEDITTEVLADTNYTFLMIAYSLPDAGEEYFSNFEDVNNYAREYQYKFYCLTSSPEDVILQQEKDNITNFDFCQSDERTLKTIARSNPALLLIKNGVILNKWSDKDTPDENYLNKPIEELSIGKIKDVKESERNDLTKFALLFLIPLVFLKILDAGLYHRKKDSSKDEVLKEKE